MSFAVEMIPLPPAYRFITDVIPNLSPFFFFLALLIQMILGCFLGFFIIDLTEIFVLT